MEYGNFGNPNFETPDHESDESDATKKKKKKRGVVPAETTVESTDEQKKEELAKQGESIWKKLIGERPEAAETDDAETNTEELEAAVEGEEATVLTPELTTENSVELSETDAPLESLSLDEERYALEAYLAERVANLETEVSDNESDDEKVARQANLAFLTAVRSRLELSDTEDSVEEPVEQAYALTLESFGFAPAPSEEERGGGDETISSSQSITPTRPAAFAATPAPQYEQSILTNTEQSPVTTKQEVVYDRSRTGSALLVGGVIGYLVGRRRGRIKTERRMSEVQHKLERRVEAVQSLVIQKEVAIQRLSREKAAVPAAHVEAPRIVSRPERPMPAVTRSVERPSQPARTIERAPKAAELATKDALAMGEKIVVGGTNLRQVYEAKLISESGLKRLVQEHLQGADIRRGLAREFMVKEMSFERDPRLRDSVTGIEQTKAAGTAGVIDSADDTPTIKNNPLEPAVDMPTLVAPPRTDPPRRGNNVSSGLLIALTLLTIGLAIYAVLLSLNR